ncbi:Uncharacterized protein TPAR_07451 [Tolypocladium paradoxum]|uniref:DNA polymerase delta subunit 3 n=1 Tax=Tolypocladium paradoxum TaxID=94208 RepID=A0A2S4KQ95_9HYPO|nr:Uncharacterized protein TPAR_07451 [Tolypocladium paradoxum]
MDENKKFLADRLLSEERPVGDPTALLLRELTVSCPDHVSPTEQSVGCSCQYRQMVGRAAPLHHVHSLHLTWPLLSMLYDFHKYQNALRADSVRATYLVYGAKSAKSRQENGDVEMSSSMPEPEPLSEAISTKTLTLVAEQNLQDLLAEYQQVTSVHIYSLAPHSQRDLAVLAEVSSSISEYPKEHDPAAAANKYGTILNPDVRRRDRGGRPAIQAATASKPIKPEPAMVKPAQAAKVKQEAAGTPSKDITPLSSSAKNAAPTTKRGVPGGIMQSFAKAASKPPSKPKQAAKKEEDGTMALSDDGEADDSDMPPSKKADKDADAARKSRKEREEELRRMMEEDDDEEEPGEKDTEPDDEEMGEAPEPVPMPEPETRPDSQSKEDKEPAEVVSSSGGGWRRGKRRVMKKKRILDDQGYMVTIQEPGWESFSEDDASQPPAKKATPTSTPSSSGPKAKRAAGKTGQGNIMSFFSKK